MRDSSLVKKLNSDNIPRRKRFRTLVLLLSALVVFVTTYMLILPAITLDEEEALEQGGIDLVTEENLTENTAAPDDESGGDDALPAEEDQHTGDVRDNAAKAAAYDSANASEKDARDTEETKTPVSGTSETQLNEGSTRTETDGADPEYLTEETELTFEGEDYTVLAVVDASSNVPKDVDLEASEITPATDRKLYKQLYNDAIEALKEDDIPEGSVRFAKFYDISLVSDGDCVEPESDVSVKIEYDKGTDFEEADTRKANTRILHFTEDGVEIISKGLKVRDDSVSFDADSFSVYAVVTLGDLGELDGKTFGILNTQDGTKPQGIALSTGSATVDSKPGLKGQATTVRVEPVSHSENVYVAKNTTIKMWTFHSAGEEGKYYISITDGSTLKYLSITSDGVYLVNQDALNDSCKITVTPGTGANEGKYKFSTDNGALCLNGTNFGWKSASSTDASVWMNLAELSNLNDDDFVVYTANKVSVSDTTNVKDGDQIIIYTRIWNDATKRYDYYAIDHDGKLVLAYEGGDTISWVGSKVNTMLWNFTEYHNDDGTPNYYYELQNDYSGKYIAPQVTGGGFLSDNTIGVNLNGRRYDEYYTTIIAWDDPYYDYAGLKVQDLQLISAPMSKADTFYFAKMTVEEDEGEINQVETMDHKDYGITIKMQDYGEGTTSGDYRSKEADRVVGSSEYKQWTGIKDLLIKYIGENGYPTSNQTGKSLAELYSNAMEVNHQFLSTTYEETGYFEYDSTQNFAHLIWQEDDPWIGRERPGGGTYGIGDFVVYEQLGTTDEGSKDTLKHGQFLPYNDIIKGFDEEGNPIPAAVSTKYHNEMDIHANPLSTLDPRNGEELYNIPYKQNGEIPKYADHFFGMELSASFMQSENGLDDWGHDLIFEFSGDDDFWLYVDDMLVLDIGGVHSALDGKVNFRTGEVTRQWGQNGTQTTTLRALYKDAYKQKNPSATDAEVEAWLDTIFKDGGTVFKDYTGHTMRMFYMERGAGASNLHMRFNLAPYTDGEVLLEKEVTSSDSVNQTFPFQIYYKDQTPTGEQFVLLSDETKVKDYLTGKAEDVGYSETYTVSGLTYENVFFLKPGQTVAVQLPSENTEYYFKECAIDPGTFDPVSANDEVLTGADAGETGLKDFSIEESTVVGRKKVIYENHVSDNTIKSLNITKRLWQDDARDNEILSGTGAGADNTEFKFRIYIGKQNEEYQVYNTGKYYVKDPEGNYCIYENGSFVSTGKTNFADLDTTVPEGEWKSQQEKATFYSSPGGAIDKIKAGYTIEIPELMAGIAYKIVERDDEIPVGYNLLGYNITEGAYSADNQGEPVNEGVISYAYSEETVSVHNQHGYGLNLKKIWSDAAFMESHDDIYFAVYLKGSDTPVDGSVRRLHHPATALRWFFPELEEGRNLNDYEVYEVELTVPEGGSIEVDPDTGEVSGYSSITRKFENDSIEIEGVSNEHGYSANYTYTVSYVRQVLTQAEINDGANSRKDTVTNGRPGIKIVKTDMNDQPLANAAFVLKENSAETDQHTKRFTSDEAGLIVMAYLSTDKEYKLSESNAPSGYQKLIDDLIVKVGSDGTVYVNGSSENPENGYYTIKQVQNPTAADMPVISIRNKDYSLRAVKTDAYTDAPMEGVKFALYKEVVDYNTGNHMPDYVPMEGYEELITDPNGVIPGILLRNSENPTGLRPGVYYLREEESPNTYNGLNFDVRITISPTGEITLDKAIRPGTSGGNWTFDEFKAKDGVTIGESESGGLTITIKNTPKKPIRIIKKATGTEASLDGARFELYRADQIQDGQPIEGADHLINDVTSNGGILMLGGLEPNISYYLIETEAPQGFLKLDKPVIITRAVAANGSERINATYDGKPLTPKEVTVDGKKVWQIRVDNYSSYELPATGGTGTAAIYLTGAILTAVCGAGILVKRRKRKRA